MNQNCQKYEELKLKNYFSPRIYLLEKETESLPLCENICEYQNW